MERGLVASTVALRWKSCLVSSRKGEMQDVVSESVRAAVSNPGSATRSSMALPRTIVSSDMITETNISIPYIPLLAPYTNQHPSFPLKCGTNVCGTISWLSSPEIKLDSNNNLMAAHIQFLFTLGH